MSTSILSAQEYFLFIGTYTKPGSNGIYVAKFNSATGKLDSVSAIGNIENPSFLAISPGAKYVYAVNETAGSRSGEASSFSFDRSTGKLTFINNRTTGGDNPCYIAVHSSGKWVTAGNYSGGNLAVFPVDGNGALLEPSQIIDHSGSSINKQRQEKPHVHATRFSNDEQYLYVPDLGTDKIHIYPFNAKNNLPVNVAAGTHIASTAGSGPRHITEHHRLPMIFVIEELSGNVSAYRKKGTTWTKVQTIDAHPDDYKEIRGSADIHLSPDGKFLYASNRGKSNSIAIFQVDQVSGKLNLKGFQSTLGITPRNFVIDPSGKFLLAANQQSGSIIVFARDSETGLLKETGESFSLPSPVCLKFLDAASQPVIPGK